VIVVLVAASVKLLVGRFRFKQNNSDDTHADGAYCSYDEAKNYLTYFTLAAQGRPPNAVKQENCNLFATLSF
jgi:hypothetical protein